MNQILGIKEIIDSPKEFGDGDIKCLARECAVPQPNLHKINDDSFQG